MKGALSYLTSIACAFTMAVSPASASETINYTYDAQGRLVAQSSSGSINNGNATTISYDSAGNRACLATTIGTANTTCVSSSTGGSGNANIAIANASITEGGTLSFAVTRTGNTASSVSVSYSAASGSATSGADFTSASGTLNFAANQINATIYALTIDDAIVEPNETLSATLSAPSAGAAITAGAATGTISDNDFGWQATLAWGTSTVCFGDCITFNGYIIGMMGSMSNTAWNGYTVYGVYDSGGSVSFYVNGATAPPNSGWTTITVPGVGILYRTAATYAPNSYTGSGYSIWTWNIPSSVASGMVTIQ